MDEVRCPNMPFFEIPLPLDGNSNFIKGSVPRAVNQINI